MQSVTIHQSGEGADKMQVISYGNGTAYAANFGETGSPMRSIYFQGEDATQIRNEFDALENSEPDTETRDIWMRVLDPYL